MLKGTSSARDNDDIVRMVGCCRARAARGFRLSIRCSTLQASMTTWYNIALTGTHSQALRVHTCRIHSGRSGLCYDNLVMLQLTVWQPVCTFDCDAYFMTAPVSYSDHVQATGTVAMLGREHMCDVSCNSLLSHALPWHTCMVRTVASCVLWCLPVLCAMGHLLCFWCKQDMCVFQGR